MCRDDGSLLLYTPPTDALTEELGALGPVRWLVVPNCWDHLGTPAAAALCPEAHVGCRRRLLRWPHGSLDLALGRSSYRLLRAVARGRPTLERKSRTRQRPRAPSAPMVERRALRLIEGHADVIEEDCRDRLAHAGDWRT